MRQIIIAIILSTLASTPATANTTGRVEFRVFNTGTSTRPVFGLNTLIEHTLTPKLKVWAWFQVEEKWAEAYTGLAYAPAVWFEFGLAAGVEQADLPWRLGGYVWMGNKYFSFLALVEEGGSGPWYQATFLAKPLAWLEFGGMIKRYAGLGYRLDFSPSTGPNVKLWVAHLFYDPESNSVDVKRILGGLVYSF